HGVGFTYTGRGSKKNTQLAALGAGLFGLDVSEELVGIGPCFGHSYSVVCRLLHGVQRQVEFQHVDAGLAQYTEPAALGVSGDQSIDRVWCKAALAGDARCRVIGSSEADGGIE